MSESNKLTFEQFLAIWQMHEPSLNPIVGYPDAVRDGRTHQCPLESIGGWEKGMVAYDTLRELDDLPVSIFDAETIALAADYPSGVMTFEDKSYDTTTQVYKLCKDYSMSADLSTVRLALMGR